MDQSNGNFIGWLMRFYRNSPFHNAYMGAFLAKVLSYITKNKKNQLVIHCIDHYRYELDLNEVIDASLYYAGTFEPKIEALINKYLKPGMHAVDIGANIGYHTFRMARLVQPTGWVYAIEPSAWALNKLTKNAKLNNEIRNISFIKVGLADQDLGEQEVSFRSSYKLNGENTQVIEKINIKKLDTIIIEQNITQLDFIKLDVDGYEGKVITGSINVLKKLKPILIFEFTPSEVKRNGDDPVELIRLLKNLNYHFYNEDEVPFTQFEQYCEKLRSGYSAMILAIPESSSK